jgi:hypothetical protein
MVYHRLERVRAIAIESRSDSIRGFTYDRLAAESIHEDKLRIEGTDYERLSHTCFDHRRSSFDTRGPRGSPQNRPVADQQTRTLTRTGRYLPSL